MHLISPDLLFAYNYQQQHKAKGNKTNGWAGCLREGKKHGYFKGMDKDAIRTACKRFEPSIQGL
jgi:hypothetical protein